ncbi:MAG: hypothetical protein ACYCZJ_12140 [Sulfuriferula sp.]
MNHKKLIEDGVRTHLPTRQIARQLYFLSPSFAFDGNHEIQLQLYERICEFLRLPLSAIRLIGSGHTGFSLVKNTQFDKEKSDLDIAIVDSHLYLELFELAFEATSGWRDITKFSGTPDQQKATKERFLKYLRKGIVRPDLMPSSPRKADWENFFGKLGDDYSEFCNGISAGIYARELFMAAKQESAINAYASTLGIL